MLNKFILIILLLISFHTSIHGQDRYSKAKIYGSESELQALRKLGIALDHGEYKKGKFFISDFSGYELSIIKANGYSYDILINDVSNFYEIRNQRIKREKSIQEACGPSENFDTPEGFSLGSMGGFYTYQEFLAHLDTMFSRFPNLITHHQPIDSFTTYEGRPIFWLKISDNPQVDEPEPEVLYTALHHAREPASLSQLIMYMYFLLENYGSDEEVTHIVDNTELYFIPMVNPDGYVYNETTNPNGGGLHRKNRREIGLTNKGVDLNRNYGHHWGLDDVGSSSDPNSSTFRGSTAFSEPETQAVKFFCESHQIQLTLNYHTYGNLLIYPWGYQQSLYTPDSATYVQYAQILTEENGYNYGTGDQTVGYVTNGDSDDWMYGEQTSKNKILSFTPEAGNTDDGFWPPSSRIESISKSNIRQNLNLAHLAGKYATVEDKTSFIIDSPNSFISYNIQRLGLDSANFTVSLLPISSEIIDVGLPQEHSEMHLLESRTNNISFSLDSSIQPGTELAFLMTLDNGLYITHDTLRKFFGPGSIAYQEDGEIIEEWSSNNWGTTNTSYYTPSSSVTDSPNGNYNNNTTSTISLKNSINLQTASNAFLSFHAKWEIEAGWDFAQVLISTDNANWIPLCGKYTSVGNSNQDEGQPVYDGFQQGWVKEEIDISGYTGNEIWLQFLLKSDAGVRADGFYFDNLKLAVIDSLFSVSTRPKNNHLSSGKLFPNPNNGLFVIDDIQIDDTITILNALGQVVYHNISNSRSASINLQVLPKGIYQIKINGVFAHQMVIK